MSKSVKRSDRVFLIYLLILIVFGFTVLTSASAPMGYERFHDIYYFVKRQFLFGLLPGLAVFLVVARLPYTFIKTMAWPFYLLALAGLVAVFIPGIGLAINGSRSWISVGLFNFQPAELAKLAIIIIMAGLLAQPERDLNDWQNGLLPVLAVVSPAVLLILLQPDIGTLSILIVIIFALLFLSRVPSKFLLAMAMVGGVAFMAILVAAPYRVQRLTVFLHPELDPLGVGYHVNQAFLAVGSGGFWGLGFGQSRQKFQYLPEVNADSIFAIIAEELGFVVAAGLIILILLITKRGLRIAKEAPDEFGRLLVGGIMVWFFWQSFLNIGAMVGAMPLTGVPLLFISHGGSAMLTGLMAMGIVAAVSRAE
ncbi:MAG: putative peptidoglycan glycosyltransferase FtsW [bacterium]|nr:putative peptidoglycan glycosyltransferase FtsW [bacterium]